MIPNTNPDLTFNEADIEDFLWMRMTYFKNERIGDLCLPEINKSLFFRQVNLGHPYGILDILQVTIYKDEIRFTIYELKKDSVGASTLFQAYRYGAGLRRMVDRFWYTNRRLSFRFVLIGTSVSESDFTFASMFGHVEILLYSLSEGSGSNLKRYTPPWFKNEMIGSPSKKSIKSFKEQLRANIYAAKNTEGLD